MSQDEDKAAGKLLMANPAGSGLWSVEDVKLKSFPDDLGQFLKGFGQSLDGEIYVVTSQQIGPQGTTGKVYKLAEVQ